MSQATYHFELKGWQTISVQIIEAEQDCSWQLVLPYLGCELVLNLGDIYRNNADAPEPTVALFGPRKEAELLRPGRRVALVLIRFRPELNSWIATALNRTSVHFGMCEMTAQLPQAMEHGQRLLSAPARSVRTLIASLLEPLGAPAEDTSRIPLASLSPRGRYARFNKTFGLSPKQVQRAQRIDSVAQMLTQGDHPLAEIAAAHGYTDQAHFSRETKRHLHMTPSSLRGVAQNNPALFLPSAEIYKA